MPIHLLSPCPILSRLGGKIRMRKLMGQDKDRETAYQLQSEAKQIQLEENSFNQFPLKLIWVVKTKNKVLKQHLLPFFPQVQLQSCISDSPPLHPEQCRGIRDQGLCSMHNTLSDAPSLYWSLAPTLVFPRAAILQEKWPVLVCVVLPTRSKCCSPVLNPHVHYLCHLSAWKLTLISLFYWSTSGK